MEGGRLKIQNRTEQNRTEQAEERIKKEKKEKYFSTHLVEEGKINKAEYLATFVAQGWAGAVMRRICQALWQERRGKKRTQ